MLLLWENLQHCRSEEKLLLWRFPLYGRPVLPEEGDKEEIGTAFEYYTDITIHEPRALAIQGQHIRKLKYSPVCWNTTRQLQQQPFPEWCANTGTGRKIERTKNGL